MKGIFKKTLACALAAGVLTSSVTAFAASGLKTDEDYYTWGSKPKHEYWAKSIPTITQYSNVFDFSIKTSELCGLELRWNLYQESTGKEVGKEDIEYIEDGKELLGHDSAALPQWGNVRAICNHNAYWNATIIHMTTNVTTLPE